MSRRTLAIAVGVTEMSVYRIEEKGQEPSASTIARILKALHLPWRIAEELLLNQAATAADGAHAAETALLKEEEDLAVEEISTYVLSLPIERRSTAIRILRAFVEAETGQRSAMALGG